MLEMEYATSYANYLIYLCPKCLESNIFISKNKKCYNCGAMTYNCDLLQTLASRRLRYYTRGDTHD